MPASGVVLGIDGCPGGWIAALRDDTGIIWRQAPLGALASILDDAAVAAIDMPIGLAERGWRSCDLLGRERLGAARARLFLTPPRAVLALGMAAPNADVQRLSRALTGQGTSRQAMALSARIMEVDALVPDDRIVEVHPELSFMTMAGEVLPSKHRPEGIAARVAVLTPIFGEMTDGPAPIVDRLDAVAALWSAERVLAGAAEGLPEVAALDGRGVPMRILT